MTERAFVRQRPLVTCALCYGAGVLLGGLWLGFHWHLPVLGLVLASISAVLLRKQPGLHIVSSAATFLFLGVLLAGLAANPSLPPEGKFQIQGRVTGQAVRREKDGRITARLAQVSVLVDETEHKVPSAHWTYFPAKGAKMPLDGQTASFHGTLYHPAPQENPKGFDFRAYLLQKEIPIGVSGARDLTLSPAGQIRHESPWIRLRLALAERFDVLLNEQAPLAKALILGIREDLPEETTQAFRSAGVAHVLAVSGLHVSLLVMFLNFVLKKLNLSPRVLLLIFTLLLFGYCRLLDFSASIVRASLLTLIYLLGKALHRRVDPLTSLAAAFLLILLVRPLDLFSLGFQLSFLAVAGIILLGDQLHVLYQRRIRRFRPNKLRDWLATAYLTTLSASALTALPLTGAFHYFSLIGLMISPFAIAGVFGLMILYLGVLLISAFLMPLAQMLGWIAMVLTWFYEGAVAWVSRIPFAVLRLPGPAWWQILLVTLLIILLTRYVMIRMRWRVAAISAMVAALVILPMIPVASPVRYIQLSAGFADSAIILDGDKTLVIDTGSHGGDLSNFLLSEGRTVDALIITHLHADHVGGLEQLLDSGVVIREMMLPDGALDAQIAGNGLQLLQLAQNQGTKISFLGAGDEIALNKVRGRVLWPYQGKVYPGLAANLHSLVTLWDLDGVSLLNAGDISADYSRYLEARAQVLKVPHHGSRHDATLELIQKVRTELALITASETQPDRFQQALKRLLGEEARVLITGETGAITLTCEEGEVRVDSHLRGGIIHGL